MLVQTEQQMEAAFTVLVDADRIVVDTETFYITPGVEPLQLGTVCYAPIKGVEGMDASFYFPFRHQHTPSLFPSVNLPQKYLGKLKVALERSDVELIFHNAKFDLAVLKRDGIVPKGKIWDTMLMSHMNDENGPHALKRLGKEIVGVDADKEEKQIKALAKTLSGDAKKIGEGWHLIPPDAMVLYAEKDVALTYRLWEHFTEELTKQYGAELFEILYKREEEFLYVLLEMEETGVLIDVEQARQLADRCETRRGEIQAQLGFDPMKPDQLAQQLFAPEPRGLGFVPQSFGKPSASYPNGRPVMDKHVLARFDHPVVESVLEYRGLVKAESTWFNGFLMVTWPDGRVHPDFRQHGTLTTRLSCANPNMQQLPRVDEEDIENAAIKSYVKSIISAPEGYEVWEFDYSQLEPRLATCYSQDPTLLDIYNNGRDIYQEIADTIGITRYQAKQLMLAIMYGAGKAKTAEMLGVSEEVSYEIVQEFWSTYPRLQATVRGAYQAAQQRGWVRLWTGRRRHFKWPSEYYKAFNSVLQGGGAEIVKESGLRLKREVKEARIISQVHDSYWFEIPTEHSESIRHAIQQVMEWPNEEFFVPFPVEGKRIA